jgi:hypothetical protein
MHITLCAVTWFSVVKSFTMAKVNTLTLVCIVVSNYCTSIFMAHSCELSLRILFTPTLHTFTLFANLFKFNLKTTKHCILLYKKSNEL